MSGRVVSDIQTRAESDAYKKSQIPFKILTCLQDVCFEIL